MQNINFVDLDFIMERYKNEELPTIEEREERIKEWIYEAIRKIGSLSLYEAAEETISVVDGFVKVPRYINHLVHVKDENNNPLVKVASEVNNLTSRRYYMIRGNTIRIPQYTGKITIEYLRVPEDDNHNPLVLDNEYVISAVVAYIAMKAAKKLWLINRLATPKYNDFEQEWLFYVGAASESVDIPSFDELEGWETLNLGFPVARMVKNNK